MTLEAAQFTGWHRPVSAGENWRQTRSVG